MYPGLSLPSSRAYDTASSGSRIAPRVSDSSTPKRWSAVCGPCVERMFRFFDRISARAMRQSLSALVRAIACSDFAAWAEVTDWRYCQIDVAIRPARPRNSVDSGPWYSWRNLASLLFFLELESPPPLSDSSGTRAIYYRSRR